MSAHKPCSPSSYDRFSKCPAFIREVESMNKLGLSDTSEYAIEGSMAHKYAEQLLTGQTTIEDIPCEFRPGVELYVNSILADLQFGGELLGVEEFIGWHTDSRVGGTPDCVLRIGNCLVIVDFKYGANEYVPADAMQLQIYGLLAAIAYGKETDTQIELRVIQPRYIQDDVKPIRSAFFRLSALVDSVSAKLLEALQRVDADPDCRIVGDHCKWCPATRLVDMPPCPAHLDQYIKLFDAAPIILRPEKMKDLKTLSEPEQIKLLLDSEYIILKLLDFAKRKAHDLLHKGEKIDGYSLKEAFANRTWADEDEVIAATLRKRGLLYRDIYIEKIISPAQAEKLAGKGKIDDLTTRESKGLTLHKDKKITKEIKSAIKQLLSDPIKRK